MFKVVPLLEQTQYDYEVSYAYDTDAGPLRFYINNRLFATLGYGHKITINKKALDVLGIDLKFDSE